MDSYKNILHESVSVNFFRDAKYLLKLTNSNNFKVSYKKLVFKIKKNRANQK